MNALYTTHDVSQLLQVDPSTVSKWVDRGILTAFRTPGGHRRIRATDLRSFCISHQMPIPEELGSNVIRLLVVDDERHVLDAIKRQFKPHANEVQLTTTTSAVEAVLLVSETKPHGLLLDLNMPDLNGLEVCRRIRSRKQLEGVTLIAMTGQPSSQLAADALAAGAVACLEKPISVEQVLSHFQVPLSLARSSGGR